jgi:light-regulated signal transduction histidine kinase (bacteriophytochrome)
MSPPLPRSADRSAEKPEDAEIQRLRAVVEELRARLRAEQRSHSEDLHQFTYAVSHDFREPLRMVSSYTQLLARRYHAQLDENGREFMRYILDAVERMDVLLAGLLTYSQQFRTAEQVLSPVDSEAALQGVLLKLEKAIRENGAEITHDRLPTVLLDFNQLNQIFQQLIGNAITFHGTEAPRIHVSAVEQEDFFVFAVSDNGIGIDPRYHEQIFGVFKRLHGREYPGTGIGLAICKRIVEQRGGRIWVQSEAGKGATFRFTLPK